MPIQQSWSEIRDYFAELRENNGSNHRAIYNLVSKIENSRYSEGLYGWTQMMDLCISQHRLGPPQDWEPFLRIHSVGNNQLEFRYIDTLIKSRQWVRKVDEDLAFNRLEKFMLQLHWFY